MNKQESRITLEVAIDNGAGKFSLPYYKYAMDAWNVNTWAEKEFRGNAVSKALSGYEHSNQWGDRQHVEINLDNMLSSQASEVRDFLDRFNEGDKFYGSGNADGGSTDNRINVEMDATVVAHGLDADACNGAILTGLSGGAVLITNTTVVNGTTFSFDLAEVRTWADNDPVTVNFPASIPAICKFDITDPASFLATKNFNLVDSYFGVNRDFTINYQKCTIRLRGLELQVINGKLNQVGV